MNLIPNTLDLFSRVGDFYAEYYEKTANPAERLTQSGLIDWLLPDELPDIVEWTEENINLSLDEMSNAEGFIDLKRTPYCIEPLRDWERPEVRKSVLVAIEQGAKSTSGYCGQLYAANFGLGPMLTMYPSAELAIDVNRDRIEPLAKGIPHLKQALERHGGKQKEHYDFPGAPWYFSGAGKPTIAKSFKFAIIEEPDFYNESNQANDQKKKNDDAKIQVSNIRNIEKRQTSYDGDGAFTMLNCSPTLLGAPAWKEYLKTSQGVWHLRCQKKKCNKLISSCIVKPEMIKGQFVGGIKYKTNAAKEIITDSIRLECPHCRHQHRRKQLYKMNQEGEYKHKFPKRKKNRGYRWGRLAVEYSLTSWEQCADALKDTEENASRETQMFFAQTIEGRPYEPQRITQEKLKVLHSHIREMPDPAIITDMYLAADTQNDGFYYVVRGYDEDDNSYLLDAKFCKNQHELFDWGINFDYDGIRFTNYIIDEGGQRSKEVQEFVEPIKGFYTYKGDTRACSSEKWKRSKTKGKNKLILAHPYRFQADLLYQIYNQHDETNNYWALPPQLDEAYMAQVLAHDIQKDKDYEDWRTPSDKTPDHFLDCEKMLLVIREVHQAAVGKKRGRSTKEKRFTRF